MSIEIDGNAEHFAKGYRRAVVTDKYGDELVINVTPYDETFICVNEICVAVTHVEMEVLKEFFASL